MDNFSLKNKYHTNAFEGWYTRILSDDGTVNLAVIMAMTLYEEDPHAFIQVFDGNKENNTYHRFDIEDFHFEQGMVKIKTNTLSLKHLFIDVEGLQVDVTFKDVTKNPVKSAMGFLRHLPLQCFQEVNILSALAQGSVNGSPFKGSTYIEKTYGKQFPKRWFWLQADRFDQTVKLSLAGGHVPTLKMKPFGFFCLLKTDTKTYRFATYNLATFKHKRQNNTVTITIKRWPHTLTLTITPGTFTLLKGPGEDANMVMDVPESLNTHVSLTLKTHKDIVLKSTSTHAGFEWVFDAS